MFIKGNLQLPPPQIILFNVFKNLKEKGMTIQHLFLDKELLVEPMMFQFNAKLDIVVHGDEDYKMGRILESEPEEKNGAIVKEYLRLLQGKGTIRRRIRRQETELGVKAIFEYTGSSPEGTLFKYLPHHSASL
jgi:hypothetical protein